MWIEDPNPTRIVYVPLPVSCSRSRRVLFPLPSTRDWARRREQGEVGGVPVTSESLFCSTHVIVGRDLGSVSGVPEPTTTSPEGDPSEVLLSVHENESGAATKDRGAKGCCCTPRLSDPGGRDPGPAVGQFLLGSARHGLHTTGVVDSGVQTRRDGVDLLG